MSVFRSARRDPSEVFSSTLWHPVTGSVMDFLVTSPLLLVTDVHFVSKLELCMTPLSGCPLCAKMPARRIGMLFSGSPRSVGMLQIGDVTIAQLMEIMSERNIRSPLGLRLQFLRNANKRPLKVKALSCDTIPDAGTIPTERAYQAALRLFGLPIGNSEMTLQELEEQAEPFLATRLLQLSSTVSTLRQSSN